MKKKIKIVSTEVRIVLDTGEAFVWGWCPETSRLYKIGIVRGEYNG